MTQLTKEQRQEIMAKARAAKAAKPPQPQVVEETPQTLEPLTATDKKIVDSLNDVLNQLGSGQSAERVELVTNQIVGKLHEVPLAARIELTKHPLIQEALHAQDKAKATSVDLPPGTILPGGPGYEEGRNPKHYPWTKIPWTRQKQIEVYGMVDFIPPTSQIVTVNGISWQLIAEENNRVPSIIRDVYLQSRADTRRDYQEFQNMMKSGALGGFQGTYKPGVGWNPEEPGFENQGQ